MQSNCVSQLIVAVLWFSTSFRNPGAVIGLSACKQNAISAFAASTPVTAAFGDASTVGRTASEYPAGRRGHGVALVSKGFDICRHSEPSINSDPQFAPRSAYSSMRSLQARACPQTLHPRRPDATASCVLPRRALEWNWRYK
jgi:hypothetical protein